MNRLVLIGNGFDLAHGLKTRYEDFFYWYWRQCVGGFVNNHTDVSEDLLCKLTTIKENTWSMQLYYDTCLKYETDGKEIFDHLKDERLFKIENSLLFERICKGVETKGWVDIEQEYYNILVYLIEFVNDNFLDLNRQLDYLRSLLQIYLKAHCTDAVSLINSIKDKIYQPIKKTEIAVANQGIYGDNTGEKPPSSIMLLNFNYTSTPEIYLDHNSNTSINYIHGSLDDISSMIFGFGDELDDAYQKLRNSGDNECLRNLKSIRYLESDNYRKLIDFIESAPFQVCIMGHSCGNSDRTLLNTLFEHRNCVSIIPYYYIKEDGTDNYLELVQNISRNFTDMKLMRDRVVNKKYCDPLSK